MHQITSTSATPDTRTRSRVLRVALTLSLLGASATAGAQAATESGPAVAPIQPTPAFVAAQQTAGTPATPATNGAEAPRASSIMLDQHAVGLTRAVRSDAPAPAPMMKRETTRTNTALMIVGAAAVILGAAVGDDAGTVLIIGGAGVGLYGLYRFLN